MTPGEREGARLATVKNELVKAARDYFLRSELNNTDEASIQAAQRLADLLDADDNQKVPSQ